MSWLSRIFGGQKENRKRTSMSTGQRKSSEASPIDSAQSGCDLPNVTPELENTGNAELDQALYQASTSEKAEALIKKGADVNAKNSQNGWPCIYACAYLGGLFAHESEVNKAYVLLKYGANINVWTPEGNTPLGTAVMRDNKELVRLFVEHGADVNFCKPDDGCTPLHVAAINGNISLAKYLIERGAKVDAKDASGKMPVDCAREYKEKEMVEFLNAQPVSEQVAPKIHFDKRLPLSIITEEMILNSICRRCSKATTRQSLTLYAGNDFYVCPKCAAMFCDRCILTLPLTGSPGYAKCPACDIQLKRAIPGLVN